MNLPRDMLDQKLAALARDMPVMLAEPNEFFRDFEDRSEQILGQAAPEDQAYVLQALQDLIDQSGVNDRFANQFEV